MTELQVVERCPTFETASHRAQAIAIQNKQQTGVRRNADTWEVMAPTLPHKATNQPAAEQLANQVVERDERDDQGELLIEEWDGEDGEQELLMEEMGEDRENAARSDDDGWYYDDKDGSDDSGGSDSQFGRFQAPRDQWGRTLRTGSGW